MNPDLLIAAATEFEVSRFLSRCPGSSGRKLKTGCKLFTGRIGEQTYELLVSGPGVFNAAQALAAYLSESAPSLIINTGIAGIFKSTGGAAGDIAVATHEQYLHTGVQTDAPVEKAPLPFDLIADSPLSRKGIYPLDEQTADFIHGRLNRKFSSHSPARLHRGGFMTVSTITASFEYADRIYGIHRPVMESMEGAACAHVAACHHISFAEIRCASNFTGERDKSNWDMDLAVKNLGEALAAI